jgi:ESS family glutamate:Na+ symporter
MLIELGPSRVVLVSILTLALGYIITRRVSFLPRISVPIAVTGGVTVAVCLAVLNAAAGVEIAWHLGMRDELLLVFFASVGLSAKVRDIGRGGRLFARLALLTILFLVVQNAAGALGALAVGQHAAYGLVGGSVSLSGGHGTAITWGRIAAEWGYTHVMSHGLAFATFGLIAGGLLGGPVSGWIISSKNLEGPAGKTGKPLVVEGNRQPRRVLVTEQSVLLTLLVFAVCYGFGAEINRQLSGFGLVLPGFVTAMLAGVLLTNLVDLLKLPLHEDLIKLAGDVCLNLFLVMSLVSLDLNHLSSAAIPIAVLLLVQIVVAVAFARWVVFRWCGGDYDAAVISAGFVGICLGATPVAMANMGAVTQRHGPSPRAFLVVPLIGAGVLDLANAFIIEGYLKLLL